MNEKNRRYYFAQGFVAQADEIFFAFPPPTVGIKPFKLELPVVGDAPLNYADLRHKCFLTLRLRSLFQRNIPQGGESFYLMTLDF